MTQYYCAQSGSDLNPGTIALPWLHCPGMVDWSGPSDCFDEATFDEDVIDLVPLSVGDIVSFKNEDTWTKSGISAPFIVGTAGVVYEGTSWGIGNRAIFNITGIDDGNGVGGTVFFFNIDDYTYQTMIMGMHLICRGYASGICFAWPYTVGDMIGAKKYVSNNYIDIQSVYGNSYGIIAGPKNGKKVQNLDILDNTIIGKGPGNTDCSESIALYAGDEALDNQVVDVLVRGNTIDGCHYGLIIKNHIKNCIAEFNVIKNGTSTGINLGSDSLSLYGPENITLRYNLDYTNGQTANGAEDCGVLFTGTKPFSCACYGNIIYNNYGAAIGFSDITTGSILRIYNNTCYKNATGRTLIAELDYELSGTFTTFEVKDNIFVAHGATIRCLADDYGRITSHTNNLYYSDNNSTFVYANGDSYGSINMASYETALVTLPIFKDVGNLPTEFSGIYGESLVPNNDGLSVLSGSAVDHGIYLSVDYNGAINLSGLSSGEVRPQGLGWDIGAYEYLFFSIDRNNYFDEAIFDEGIYDSISEPINNDFTAKWNEIAYINNDLISKWNSISFISIDLIARWGSMIGADFVSKWDTLSYTESDLIAKWNGISYIDNDLITKWNSSSYIYNNLIAKWNELFYVNKPLISKWNELFYLNNNLIAKWGSRILVGYVELIAKWTLSSGVGRDLIALWHESTISLAVKLTNYLEVVTKQNTTMYPTVISGTVDKLYDAADMLSLVVGTYIPDDAIIRLWLNESVKIFEGVSKRCLRQTNETWLLDAREAIDVLKPSTETSGHILSKYLWEDVQLQYLVSSNKPSLNNNILGILYMAASAIPWQLFTLYSNPYDIYQFAYEGMSFVITEVFEDTTTLTSRANLVALNSASGWYHDSVNKVLYVRTSDGASPYYHVISVPYLFDRRIPIRIGYIANKSTEVIIYYETAHGDIPMDSLGELLYSQDLEYEKVVKNGICYINVAETVGSGSPTSPAKIYREGINILNPPEVDMSDARYVTFGVLVNGYGSGAGAVAAGKFKNLGYGGSFITLNDATIHGLTQANDYATQYLSEMYLPARRVTTTVPLKDLDMVDLRSIGDTVRFILPSVENFDQVLRVKQLKIYLETLTMEVTAGDTMFTYEDRLKALQSAAAKYIRHLQATTDAFSWSYSENIDNGVHLDQKFTVKADVLTIQKLSFSLSTAYARTDQTDYGSGGGSGDGGGSGGSDPQGSGHKHTLAPGSKTAATDATAINVGSETHTHPAGSLVNADNTSGITVASSIHTHTATTSAPTGSTSGLITGLGQACCTAVNCGKAFYNAITSTASVASTSHTHTLTTSSLSGTIDVAAKAHTHTISGSTGVPSATVQVAPYNHTHSVEGIETTEDTATIADSTFNYASTQDDPVRPTDPATGDPQQTYDSSNVYSPYGSNPEMYFKIEIGGQDIAGSPFVILGGDSVGPVLIDNLVTAAGDYTIKFTLTNKTAPADKCKLRFTAQIDGTFFVDTISKGT